MKTLLLITLFSSTNLWSAGITKISEAYIDQDGRILMFDGQKGFLGDSSKAKSCTGCTNYSTLGFTEIRAEFGSTIGNEEFTTGKESSDPKSNDGYYIFKCANREVKFKSTSKEEKDILNKKIMQGTLKLEIIPEPKFRFPNFLLKNPESEFYVYADSGEGYDTDERKRIYIIRNGKTEQLKVTFDESYLDGGSRSITATDSKGTEYSIEVPASSKKKLPTVNYEAMENMEIGKETQGLLSKLGIDISEYNISKVINNNPCTESRTIVEAKSSLSDKGIFDGKRDFKARQNDGVSKKDQSSAIAK